MRIMTWVRWWIARLLKVLGRWRRRPAPQENTEATPPEALTTVVPPVQTPANTDLPPESSVTANHDIHVLIDNTYEVDAPEAVNDEEARNDLLASNAPVHDDPKAPANAPDNEQPTIVQNDSDDVGPPQNSSQSSEDNTAILASAEEQLQSIPSSDDPTVETPPRPATPFTGRQPVSLIDPTVEIPRPATPFTGKRPVSLIKLIDYIDPENLFRHFPIHQVIAVREVSESLKIMVDDYFLHRILPWSEITLHSTFIHGIEGRPERESEILIPVIRRIEKENRFLPYKRVLFEPKGGENRRRYYCHGKFEPRSVEFRLKDGTRYTWDLTAEADIGSQSYRNDRRSHRLTLPPLKHKKIYQYYKFETFTNSPAQVFYKDRHKSE